jgi:hypothetical protein
MDNQKELRRKYLEHSLYCPMKDSIGLECICHYDDCLNYKGTRYSHDSCICHILTAKFELFRAEWDRLKLPFLKRIFTRKPKLIDFIKE